MKTAVQDYSVKLARLEAQAHDAPEGELVSVDPRVLLALTAAMRERDALKEALVVQLGRGDVGIMCLSDRADKKTTILALEPGRSNPDGEPFMREGFSTPGVDSAPLNKHTVFIYFPKVESVDLVMEKLSHIRDTLVGMDAEETE